MENCEKCKTPLGQAHYIICGGECSKQFHSLCVGLNEDQLALIISSENIKWVCDKCVCRCDTLQSTSMLLNQVLKQYEWHDSVLSQVQYRLTRLENLANIHEKPKDINEPSAPADSDGRCVSILKRKKYLIAGACAMITLIVLAIVFGIEVSAENKNTTSGVFGGTYEDDGCVEGQLCLVDRGTWRAHPQKNKLDPQTLPLQRVVIAHTASEPCNSLATCSERVRVIQEYHMNSFEWDDIGYNFLVSSDGRIYVGRGWDDVGAVVKGFNTNSVGIAFIGTYVKTKPTEAQLKACLLLLEEGVRLKKLKPDYILNGARQLSATESPGDALYRIIQTWPHWTSKIYL